MIELQTPKDRIIFAADVQSTAELSDYLKVLDGEIGIVKLGMGLLTRALLTDESPYRLVCEKSRLRIMWDLKYKDIPPQMEDAVRNIALCTTGRIFGFTVHCTAGPEALRKVKKIFEESWQGSQETMSLIIGVTLLTSLDNDDLDKLGSLWDKQESVAHLAELAAKIGIPAIVCSPQETAIVRRVNPEFVIINPGIRFTGFDVGAQKRVDTPGNAIRNGADYVVMGSDLRKGDPVANARRAAAEIAEALKER